MVYSFFNIFSSFCEFLIYQKYLKEIIGVRKTTYRTFILIFASCVFFYSITSPQMNPYINLTINISALFLFALQYKCSFIIRLVCVFLYVGIEFMTEPLGILFLEIDNDKGKYLILITELIRYVVVLIISQMKLSKIVTLPRNISSLLLIIPIISVLNYCLVVNIAVSAINLENILLCITIVISIAATNYLLFYIFNKFNLILYQKHEDELYIQEMQYKEAYYAEVQECNEYVRDIKHDLKNQLLTLYDCVDHSSEFAASKIKEFLVELEHVDNRIYTENTSLNSILKIKFTMAKEQGIRTEVMVQVPMNMDIDCGDLGIVYGNLLDNAIEGCEKVIAERRYINLESKYIEGSLVVILKNSKSSEKNEGLITNKTDRRNHGRGIKSVKRVVEKYNGAIRFGDTGEDFEVNVILYGVGM